MSIRWLNYVEYGESGWGWHEEKIANPTWDQIVFFIKRLDKFLYPWVWLFTGEVDDDPLVDCLTVMGGDGVYWFVLSSGQYQQLRLFDATKGTHEVKVWTSDQGFADEEVYVTYDLDLVLRIAKHFGETGEPLPEANWESN